jgi:molecular chaperone HtpG
VLVDEASGVTSNMERILRAANQDVPTARRHLELNVRHPLVKNLATLHARGASDVAEPIARLLLDDAMLLEGSVKDASAIGRRLQGLLERAASAAVEGR